MYDTRRYLRAIEHHLISSSIVYAPVSMMATMERKPSPSGSRSSKRSQRASFPPWKFQWLVQMKVSFLGSTKRLFAEAFCDQFQGVFFFMFETSHLGRRAPFLATHFQCHHSAPSGSSISSLVGYFWWAFWRFFLGGNETKRGLNWCSAK